MKQKIRNLDHLGPRVPRRTTTSLELCLVNETHRLVLVSAARVGVHGAVTEIWRCNACGTEDVVVIEPRRY